MSGNNATQVAVDTQSMLTAELSHLRSSGNQRPLTALCLSGGGIRSAAFCLGVIQKLAEDRLLRQFHYLSTVSGGGFIGGWIQQLLHQQTSTDAGARVAAIEHEVSRPGFAALSRLRDHTNYLTPQAGPASPDTWAAIALYLRNMLVNWLLFLPVFLLAALAPVLHRTAIWVVGNNQWLVLAFGLAAFVAMGVSVCLTCLWLPSQSKDLESEAYEGDGPECDMRACFKERHRRFVLGVIPCCAFGWAIVTPVMLQFLLGSGWILLGSDNSDWISFLSANLGIPGLFFGTLLVAFGIARLCQSDSEARALFGDNLLAWIGAALVSSTVLWALIQTLLGMRNLLIHLPETGPTDGNIVMDDLRADVLTLGGPVVLIAVLLAHSAIYIGWRREARFADLDREWLARINGRILGIIVAWTVFAAACVIPSRLVTLRNGTANHLNIALSGLSAIASGFLSSWIGKQVVSRVGGALNGGGVQRLLGPAQVVLPILFVIALFAFLSAILQDVLGAIAAIWQPPSLAPKVLCIWDGASGIWDKAQADASSVSATYCPYPQWPGIEPKFQVDGFPLLLQVALGAVLVGWIVFLSGLVNVNRFSMHALYRNRLVRAFLGTARRPEDRKPEPFTDLDEKDNLRLADCLSHSGGCLFPVFNMTMNITSGARSAWAERKGASFTATPLHCGSADLSYRTTMAEQKQSAATGAFVPTNLFGGMETPRDHGGHGRGIHLGSVMTISGAAASPSWGYHSSPQIAFLMTLFNVRLGAWYANPTCKNPRLLQLAKPPSSLWALFSELQGKTRADSNAVYLSDGGHFDNLGVYEMIRRKCRYIVIIDAAEDHECAFFDLGMMIRKAEIDFPVKIDLPVGSIASRTDIEKNHPKGLLGFACGTVTYLDVEKSDDRTGHLLYLKPTLLADIPTAVRAFAASNDSFPHVTTLNQFFFESQFESYRALGYWQATKLLATAPNLGAGQNPLERLFRAAQDACARAKQEAGAP
jgi:hypothetical protein